MKTYIGDSVYAEFDGVGIRLTTENGLSTDPSNMIYLEPETYTSLVRWVDELKRVSRALP